MHFIRNWSQRIVVGVAVFMFSATAMAGAATEAAKEPLSAELILKRVLVEADGKEKLEDAANVRPGDLLEYQVIYTNNTEQTLGKLLATLPIPLGMEYEANSAQPTPAQFSTDGTQYGPEPLKREAQDKDGKTITENVPYADYRAVRWQVKTLEPGKRFIAKSRARVSKTLPPESSTLVPSE